MQNSLHNLIDSLKMFYMMNFKDGNNYFNFFILFLLTLLTFIINNDDFYDNFVYYINNIFENFKYFSPKYKSIILEGKRCLKVTGYVTKTDNLFSNRFQAFWYYISKNNLQNETIYSLKEYANSSNIYDDYGEPKSKKKDEESIDNTSKKDIFIVEQKKYFELTNDIYCKVSKNYDRTDDKKNYYMENIIVEIYSYKLSLKEIVNYVDSLEDKYKLMLENERKNKKYIYTLIGSDDDIRNYEYKKNAWDECEFISTRNFSNLFFDEKKLLLDKINFFINNKDFYEYEGHPYTFGIGLHGEPGTGKTSIIKCIANKLNRHLIVIPLSKIKTQNEFNEYFFENYYSRENNKKIGFDEKIIVFEDIDCMSNIVKKRELFKKKSLDKNITNDNSDNSDNNDNNDNNSNLEKSLSLQNKLLNKIAKKVDEEHEESIVVDFNKNEKDKITLSFILNIIDGIRETPGRILIITSNDYNSLDPALIRPGRIDITLELKNASIDVIKEMYTHYYKDIFPEDLEDLLINNIISPAKIVNMRLQSDSKEHFLNILLKEMKLHS